MKIKNLLAYINERFQFVNMALFAVLFLTVFVVSTYTKGLLIKVGLNELIGSLAVISFFFRLRVFDEIKDYAIDSINHPHRVLQSGRIELKHLKWLSAAGALLEISWCLINGKFVLIYWLAAILFAFLMRYEFFISGFLKKYLLIYAFSHMMIMPLIITWIWSAYADMSFQTNLLLLSSLSVLSGFSFEIARKIHIPAYEKPLIDSYSKVVGYKGSIMLVLLILLMGVITQFKLLQQIGSATWPFMLIGSLYLLTIGLYVLGIIKPQEKKIRASEIMVSLFMLFSYVTILIEIIF
jgi:4-hydroxybenzoate polyprenyltransferase